MSFVIFLDKFSNEKDVNCQIQLLNSISNVTEFTEELVSRILKQPTVELMQILTSTITLHSNQPLRSQVAEFFGPPLLHQLSQVRKEYESRFNPEFFSVNMDSNAKTKFFPHLVETLLPIPELHPHFLNLLVVILLQPSLRRFVKPFLEDSLILQRFSYNGLSELERLMHYPINEVTGVYFDSPEEHFQFRYAFIQEFHSQLIQSGRLKNLASLSTIEFTNCSAQLQSLSKEDLIFVLKLLHCQNFPVDSSKELFIDAILSMLYCPPLESQPQSFNPFAVLPILPLTFESLSVHDLLDRHFRLLQGKVR